MIIMYGVRNLKWVKTEVGAAVHAGKGKSGRSVRVLPDPTYKGLWRVEYTDGTLSDMVNLTRAKDAAQGILMMTMNEGKRK